jgi:hypothetical protein
MPQSVNGLGPEPGSEFGPAIAEMLRVENVAIKNSFADIFIFHSVFH